VPWSNARINFSIQIFYIKKNVQANKKV